MSFQTYINDFTTVTVAQAKDLLTAKKGDVLFIGRGTCPFCNRFAPKLHAVAKDKGLKIYFLDSSQNSAELSELREHYNVLTVPGLLVAKENGVDVRCDSSMSEEEIFHFIHN